LRSWPGNDAIFHQPVKPLSDASSRISLLRLLIFEECQEKERYLHTDENKSLKKETPMNSAGATPWDSQFANILTKLHFSIIIYSHLTKIFGVIPDHMIYSATS
jgi:hypothetical protein